MKHNNNKNTHTQQQIWSEKRVAESELRSKAKSNRMMNKQVKNMKKKQRIESQQQQQQHTALYKIWTAKKHCGNKKKYEMLFKAAFKVEPKEAVYFNLNVRFRISHFAIKGQFIEIAKLMNATTIKFYWIPSSFNWNLCYLRTSVSFTKNNWPALLLTHKRNIAARV